MKEIIKAKAEKHSTYYRGLCAPEGDSGKAREMAADASKKEEPRQRQRRVGVFEISEREAAKNAVEFKSVKQLRDNYMKKLETTAEKLQKMRSEKTKDAADDCFLHPPPSGYCSSAASAASDDEREKIWATKICRSGSSDSAVSLVPSDDENLDKKEPGLQEKPVFNPYSPRGSIDHVNVPSKTLIEAQFVPYPVDRKFSDCASDCVSDSRRHSCFTDDGEEAPPCRYWRTPSVVVSDYSDDVMGLTLEDIEYFRNQRKENSSSPESSLNSSCSNLNYCGSTISNLDAEYILRRPFRKSSDCSTCSTGSGDEEGDNTLSLPAKEQVSLVFQQC